MKSTDRRTFLKVLGAGTAAMAAPFELRAAGGPSPRIHRVHHIPVPDYTYGNRHPGVESLLFSLAADGVRLYRTALEHPLGGPDGLIAANDTVLLKVNSQWKYRGCTNSDVLRGLIQRLLEHPDGFTGEVVVVENTQERASFDCDTVNGCDGGTQEVHANAENESHSFSWVVDTLFQDPRVTKKLFDGFRRTFITTDDHATEGYRKIGTVSYPCFFTPRGTRVELKEGIWTGSGFDSQRLKWINIPVMKDHKDLNVTGCLKHMYGIMTTWDELLPHHDPYQAGQVIGDFYSLVRPPILNVLDHIWVSWGSLCGYPPELTVRRDMLCAGTDPCAMDAWSARHILLPISADPAHDPDIPGYFREYLTDARDVINGRGGLFGVPLTIEEADIVATHQDQREILLGLARSGADIRLSWAGGRPPYRVERSLTADFAAPQIVVDGVMTGDAIDVGAASGATNWFYRVTGS